MKMKIKSIAPPVFKSDGEEGEFKATFSTFNVIDKDRDVTLPGAIKRQPVRIMQYGHQWGDLPVGKGMVDFNESEAWVDAKFFTDTTHGRDTYLTIKHMAELQEWSYGFKTLEEESGMKDGQKVNYLKNLDVFEVSPVMLGAGIGTRTDSIKSHDEEDSCSECEQKANLIIQVCDAHGLTDVVSFSKVLKQALAECTEETIKALFDELTKKAPVAMPMHQLRTELELFRYNSHAMGGLRS